MAKVINTILNLRDNMSKGLVKAAREAQKNGANISTDMIRATRSVTSFKNKASKAVTDTVKKLGVLSVAAAGAFGAFAIKSGMDFEAQMSKVQAISGANAEEMQLLTDKAKEMGAKTKFSATESAQALEYMAMAGWKTDQMVSGLPGIMNLAAASGEDLASVSDIVTDALTGFGLKASDSAHFADVLAKASSSSNTNVALMGETFKYAAPVAGALKYSIEDTAVAVGLMANAGIKGEQAGTALRGVLTNLAKPSDQVAGYMDALGVSLTDTQGNVKPLSALMVDLRQKFAGLTDAQKAEYAAGIAGKEAMSGLLAIVNASDTDFNNLTQAISNSDGTAQQMADTMNNNLQGQLTLLKSAAEGIGITFYDSIKGKATDAVKGLTDKLSQWQADGTIDAIAAKVGDAFSIIMDKGSQAVSWVMQNKDGIISAIKGIGIAFGIFKGAQLFGNIVQGVHNFSLFGQTVRAVATSDIPSFASGVVNVAKKFGGFMKTAVGFVAANPIVLIIAGAITAGILIYKNWDTIKSGAIALWEKAKEVFSGITGSVSSAVQSIKDKASELWAKATEVFTGIKESIVGAFDAAKEKVSGFFSWLDNKISNIPVIGNIYEGGKGAISWVAGKLAGNALGTSYWRGGLTRVNERGGEIINLPSGTQIIPHDVSTRMVQGGGVTVNVTVMGNMIGNEQYADEMGEIIVGKILAAHGNM